MLSVLLVDDDAMLRETLADALTVAGIAVSEADNGATALAMIEGGGFDVVITDLFMPGVDGIELLMGLQRAAITTPVIVLTGGTGDAIGRSEQVTSTCLGAARALGAVRTLQKPILPSALIHEIEAASARRTAA